MESPYEVAEETFVIADELPVPGLGILPVSAAVIRGEQPMIIDTLPPVRHQQFVEQAFSLVDPEDVRWLFISHEDRDHSGNLMDVMDRCPNARIVTNVVGIVKLGEQFTLDPRRAWLLNDGESLDIGDRTITAIRPPLYDSSATRGMWDPKTRTYFSADCFGVGLDKNAQFVDDVPEKDFEEGFFWMNRVNHIWYEHVRPEAIAADAERIRSLGAEVLVSGHGPTERKDPGRLCDWIKRIGDMPSVPLPNQAEFEALLEGQDASDGSPPPS
jgi:flavorubredoxin